MSIEHPPSCGLFKVMLRKFWTAQRGSFRFLSGNCIETLPLYDINRSRLEVCSIPPASDQNKDGDHVTINGLVYHTNRTLRFISFDYDLTPQFAHTLGFYHSPQNLPFTVILNLQNEQNYMISQTWSTLNLGKL